MATLGETAAKMRTNLTDKKPGEIVQKDVSSIWGNWDKDNAQLRDVIALIPSMCGFTPKQWMTIVKGIFKDHPKVLDADKLRIMLKCAANEGLLTMRNKCGMLLGTLNKYGDNHLALAEFWEWAQRTFEHSQDERVTTFMNYLMEHRIGRVVNPIDAIENALYNHELEWEDVVQNEKMRNSILHAIRRDVSYVELEGLMERNTRNWQRFLNQEWEKHTKAAYQREPGSLPLWEVLTNSKSNKAGRRRR